MKQRRLTIPAIIVAVGLVLSLIACLVTNMVFTPSITEHDFNFSVTYKLGEETKTLEGIYRCKLEDDHEGQVPGYRYYIGEYIVDGQTTHSHIFTIAQTDEAELFIAISFNDCYLMGDTMDMEYEPFLEDPYLAAEGPDAIPIEVSDVFDADLISWEYPEPIENTFVFKGFSVLHAGSMSAMLVVGLLTIVACLIFVKKDEIISYKPLDKLSVVVNFAACFLAIPFITICVVFMQLTMSADGLLYQIYLCTPALTAFTVAASIALRRNGFTNTGFFVQFVGPVLFFAPVVLEALITNIFG